ncbi:YbfB/YjiJ family MFS transporter [Streptomyces sp. NPDC058812]|uniref:YbfB/YjiJ family MFS transporter n=1 Tax=unclassified Streptomyces TaxID=2593676 RepID=UPI0036BA6E3D
MATAVRLALGTASALGLARFAYGLLVPALQGDLGWTLADAGALSTANGLGYVVGAVLTAALVRRWGAASVFRWGMAATAVTLAGTAASNAFLVLVAMRALAYLLFAVGYITCITFLSVYLADRHASVLQEILTLTVLGAGVMATPFLWSRPMTRWPGTRVLAAVLGGPRRWRGPASAVILGHCGVRLGGGLRRDAHGSPGDCHRLHPDRAPACRLNRDIGSVHDLVRRGTDRGAVAGRRSRRTHHHRRATGVDRPPECRRGCAFGNPEQAGTPHRGTFWDQRPEHGFSTMNNPAVLAEPPWEEKSL